MNDETKKLFDAPWTIYGEPDDYSFVLQDASEDEIATIFTTDNAKRIARLPELYDALADAAERVCRKCVAFWFPGQKIDFPEDFADFTCPITKAGCFCENWLYLLKKVKDGK